MNNFRLSKLEQKSKDRRRKMSKLYDLYLGALLRRGIAVVGLLVMITIIATAHSTAGQLCPCVYPALTKLLDDGKCTPLVCTNRNIAVTKTALLPSSSPSKLNKPNLCINLLSSHYLTTVCPYQR